MYKLIFQPLANNDIQEIIAYYKTLSNSLAIAFITELEQTKNFIQNSPEAVQKKLKNIRVSYLKSFKYGIYFKIYPTEKIINILAILHTSRNPEIWKKR